MAERGSSRPAALLWIAAAVAVAGSIGVMAWIWREGGVRLGPPQQSADRVEECGAVLAGSSAMSRKLAPELIAAFLQESGYGVSRKTDMATRTVEIVGVRGDLRCTILVRASTSSIALRELAQGEILIALAQRPLNERDAKSLADAGAGDFIADRALAEHVVAMDALAIAVPTTNDLPQASVDRVRDVFVGVLTNWKGLGGRDAPIALLMPRDGNMPDNYPNDIIPVRHPTFETIEQRATMFDDEWTLVDALARNPNGVGALSFAAVRDAQGVRALPLTTGQAAAAPTLDSVRLRTYPLVRRLFFYVRPGDVQTYPLVRRLLAFLNTPAAQAAILEAGFFPPPQQVKAPEAVTVEGVSNCLFGTAEGAAVAAVTHGARRAGAPLHFEGSSLRLDREAMTAIAELGPSARREVARGGALILIGHADTSGDDERNREVAMRRALAARTAFEMQGVFGAIVESAGEMCIAFENMTPEGRRRNQRVEVWIRPGDDPSQPPG